VGASGTGKTLATQIIAAEAELPIHELDLASALTDRPDDVEHVVGAALDTAHNEGAIAVIDGGAALLGRRSPSTGRTGPDAWGGSDDVLSPLLELISGSDDLVIVTATTARAADPALPERFGAVVEFPRPDTEARVEIWRRSLPADAELPEGTLRYLASWLTWTGGTIHSCCLAAAQDAAAEGVPLQLRHVSRVLDRGYRTSARSYATEVAPPSPPPSPEPPAPTPPARPRVGRRWPVIAGGTAIAAALVGLVVALAAGATSGSSARTPSARVGAVQLSLPAGWRREAGAHPPPLGLPTALTIASPRPAQGVLIIGQLAGDSSPLPRTVLAAFSPQVAPEVVRLGPLVLYQYRTVARAGLPGGERTYVLPTTTGTVIAICRPIEASSAFLTNCEGVLETIRLRSGRALPVGVSSPYARALSAVITQLNAVRSSAARQLASASTGQAQASAALKLAQAHAQAASSVTHLAAGQAASANAALAHALLMTADSYRALALAAAHRNPSAYKTARAALATAAQTQDSAFQQLRAFGYRLG
jgi:hypothetical protein